MKASPPSAFEVAEPHFLFQIQIIAFDAPTQFCQIDHRNGVNIPAKRRKPIFCRLFLVFRPFDQQPFVGSGGSRLGAAVRHANPHSREPSSECEPACNFDPRIGVIGVEF